MQVTYLQQITQPGRHKAVEASDVWAHIMDGFFDRWQRFYDRCAPSNRRAVKLQFPAICWNGVFGNSVSNQAFKESSGLVTLDFDDVGDVYSTIDSIKEIPSAACCFVSPSGQGVKALIAVYPLPKDNIEYGQAWRSAVLHVTERIEGLEIDKSGKDVRRLCFVAGSFLQRNSFYREKVAQLAWYPPALDEPKKLATMKPAEAFISKEARILDALSYISPDDYHTWIKVGMALYQSQEVCEDGLLLWDSWSSGSLKYKPGECHKRWRTFHDSKVGTGSIFYIARQYGWRG